MNRITTHPGEVLKEELEVRGISRSAGFVTRSAGFVIRRP